MRFEFAVGNPPYQNVCGGNNQLTPLYHLFVDTTTKVADISEFIIPARFLNNAGATPKNWNRYMLNNDKVKVHCHMDAPFDVFSDVDVKGGVVILCYNNNGGYESIRVFITNDILKGIYLKIESTLLQNIGNLVYSPSCYTFADIVFRENPFLVGRTDSAHAKSVTSNVFYRYSEIFRETETDGDALVFGRKNARRISYFTKLKYLNNPGNLDKWKILLAGAIGNGTFGEQLTQPIIVGPNTAHTQTFLSMGAFDTEYEAHALALYLKTKFARALLGIMKTTHNNQSKVVWSKIPLQDFTPSSDINWSASISEIDRQLYSKYGLSDIEIEFVETNVQEMK